MSATPTHSRAKAGKPAGMPSQVEPPPTFYPSTIQPGLRYWAERNDPPRGIGPVSWVVMGQSEGGPATEACDDWMANREDAEDIARGLAAGWEWPQDWQWAAALTGKPLDTKHP